MLNTKKEIKIVLDTKISTKYVWKLIKKLKHTHTHNHAWQYFISQCLKKKKLSIAHFYSSLIQIFGKRGKAKNKYTSENVKKRLCMISHKNVWLDSWFKKFPLLFWFTHGSNYHRNSGATGIFGGLYYNVHPDKRGRCAIEYTRIRFTLSWASVSLDWCICCRVSHMWRVWRKYSLINRIGNHKNVKRNLLMTNFYNAHRKMPS